MRVFDNGIDFDAKEKRFSMKTSVFNWAEFSREENTAKTTYGSRGTDSNRILFYDDILQRQQLYHTEQ